MLDQDRHIQSSEHLLEYLWTRQKCVDIYLEETKVNNFQQILIIQNKTKLPMHFCPCCMQVYGADILTSTYPPSAPQLEPHAQNTILKQQSKADHVFCTSIAVDSAISQKQRKYASEQKLRKQAGLSRATLCLQLALSIISCLYKQTKRPYLNLEPNLKKSLTQCLSGARFFCE